MTFNPPRKDILPHVLTYRAETGTGSATCAAARAAPCCGSDARDPSPSDNLPAETNNTQKPNAPMYSAGKMEKSETSLRDM